MHQYKTKKAASFQQCDNLFVPGTGIEPVQPQWPQDFKSCVSTSSTTRAAAAKVKKAFKHRALFGDFFKKNRIVDLIS